VPFPVSRGFAATAGAALLLLTGCSSDSDSNDLATIEPAVAEQSPAPRVAPAGDVAPLPSPVTGVTFDAESGLLATLLTDSTVLLIDPRDAQAAPKTVALAARANEIGPGKPGEVLVAGDRTVSRIDLKTAARTDLAVDGDALSAAQLADGRVAAGLADGRTEVFDGNGSTETIDGLASVDGLATVHDSLAAVDRRQTSLTLYDVDAGDIDLALRAGEGATNLVADHFGRILVTDTTGGELLVYTSDPLLLRQRYPVGSSPYAIAYDDKAELVWVTLTSTNEVVGYDLSSGIPVEVKRFPTVRQPNSLAVDSAGGRLFVGSATGDGVQTIGLQGFGGR